MSILENCNRLIEKYNMEGNDIKFILKLQEELYINNLNSQIIDDTVEEYENISNQIVNYANINGLNDLKKELKEGFDPFKTNGWISVPDNLFTEEELKEHQQKRDKQSFEIIQHYVDDIPSEPNI